MTAAWVQPAAVTIVQAGDTFAWLYRGASQHMEQITQRHGTTSVLQRYVGMTDGFGVDTHRLSAEAGDILCLCSDGISKGVRIGAAEQIVRAGLDQECGLDEIGRRLVAAARKGGSTDDITVVLVEFYEL